MHMAMRNDERHVLGSGTAWQALRLQIETGSLERAWAQAWEAPRACILRSYACSGFWRNFISHAGGPQSRMCVCVCLKHCEA